MIPIPSLAIALAEVAQRWDYATDPGAFVGAPFAELGRLGWKFIVLPPLVSGGVVTLTLNSVELGMFFVIVLVPFALFFYWVISNVRRLRRTAHEINNTLQVIVGRDPQAMRRLQDAHRERLTHRTTRPR